MTKLQAKFPQFSFTSPWLDILCLAAWGILMIKYWLTGELGILIHPAYWWLTIVAGFCLLAMSGYQAWELIKKRSQRPLYNQPKTTQNLEHITVFPPGWSSGILLTTAILGLVIEPKVFVSETALHRGVNDFVPVTQVEPQSFGQVTRPEARSLIEWVRTLNVYPEPDAYTDQKAKVQGFVIHPPTLPDDFLIISRFVITCCAADAYPIGLPVKLTQSRSAYPPDTWLEIEGRMITVELNGKRQLAIASSSLNPIPKPANPYDY